jgi:hypothetical protein
MVAATGGRVLLVTAYWRTNLTLRQVAPLFEVSKSNHRYSTNHQVVIDAATRCQRPAAVPGYGQ